MNTIFGKNIGRYTLLEQLGAGGMATVYNAYDNRMERNVALKVILPSKQHSQLFLDRFNLEARALAQLSHTNVVKVLDYGEEEGLPYLVMEFVPAGTLTDRMESPIPWQEAAALLAPIARALEYVHSQKIIHRDIKPSNILLDENGHPKISDFGIVKLIENEEEAKTSTGVGVGTPEYMSPEQGMGKNVDERADIYALGVVFFEMITGQKPFSAESPMGVVIKHVTEAFPRPRNICKDLPQIVEAVILKATARDLNKRFQKMSDFADVLEELAKGSKNSLRYTGKIIGMHKRKPALAISLLAIVALCTAAWFLNPGTLQSSVKYNLGIAAPQPAPEIRIVYITATPYKITAKPTSPTTQQTVDPATPKSITPTSVNTPQVSTSQHVLMANQPLPNLKSNKTLQGATEIARWGIGNSNIAIWSNDDQTIALAGTAGIFLYDGTNFKLNRFIDTPDWINTVIFSQDGTELISGSLQNNIQVWDIKTGTLKKSFLYSSPEDVGIIGGETAPQVTCLALSQNGKLLAAGYSNGVLNVWEYASNKLTLRNAQFGAVTNINFSPDSRYITTSGVKGFSTWDLSNGNIYQLIPTTSQIITFTLSSDGKFMASGGVDWVVRYWETSGRLLKTFNAGAIVNTIQLSKDGTRLAAGLGNGQITLWDVESWKEIATIDAHPDSVRSVFFSSTGESLLTASWDKDLMVWSVPDLKNIFSLDENIQGINRLEFSQDEKWLAAGSIDETVSLWNLEKGSVTYVFEGHLVKGLNFSPDNLYLVTATSPAVAWEEGTLHVWNLQTGKLVVTLEGYQPDYEVYFSPDGTFLISGNLYNAVIWDVSTFFRLRTHGGHNAGCGVYYSPQNDVLAVISPAGILYDYNDNVKKICALREKTFVAVKLIPDVNNQNVIARQVSSSLEEVGVIFFWNYASPLRPHSLLDNQKFLGTSPDQNILFIASQTSNSLLLNKSVSFKTVATFPYFKEYQYVIASSQQGKYLAIGENDGVIHILGIR